MTIAKPRRKLMNVLPVVNKTWLVYLNLETGRLYTKSVQYWEVYKDYTYKDDVITEYADYVPVILENDVGLSIPRDKPLGFSAVSESNLNTDDYREQIKQAMDEKLKRS